MTPTNAKIIDIAPAVRARFIIAAPALIDARPAPRKTRPRRDRRATAPEVIAAEITEDLEAALEQFAAIAEDLKSR